jgi:hypothetical protein
MPRRSLIVLLSLVIAAIGRAEDTSINLAGIGSKTCSYWLSSQDRKLEGTVWIYGFWSGLNYVAVSSQQAQSAVTGAAIIGAVEAACRREPSRVLATAVWSAYIGLNAR